MSFLSLQICTAGQIAAGDPACILGGARLGMAAPAAWPEQLLPACLPAAASPAVREIWLASRPCETGCDEGIAWRRAGDVLHGVIELDESGFRGTMVPPLQAASEAAYRAIFRLLDHQGVPELWRAWNYMGAINAETDGLERYRQFNIGRQDAFLAARRGTDRQVPAACALGRAGGPLSIAFLAGATAIVPVENPRQLSAYFYPDDYGPRSPTFSRAALAYPPGQEVLFVSGTASIVGHCTVHPGDVVAQARETLVNIQAVVDAANRVARTGPFRAGMLVCRVYLRHAADYAAVDAVLRDMFGGVEASYVEADICRGDLLVEIEAMAALPR